MMNINNLQIYLKDNYYSVRTVKTSIFGKKTYHYFQQYNFHKSTTTNVKKAATRFNLTGGIYLYNQKAVYHDLVEINNHDKELINLANKKEGVIFCSNGSHIDYELERDVYHLMAEAIAKNDFTSETYYLSILQRIHKFT